MVCSSVPLGSHRPLATCELAADLGVGESPQAVQVAVRQISLPGTDRARLISEPDSSDNSVVDLYQV